MADVFDEINDDLRHQKLQEFWKENGNWIIGGAIGAVLLTGAMAFWRHWDYERNVSATAALSQIVGTDAAKLESFAADADKKHAAIARFMAADAYVQKKENDKAIAAYNEIAKTSGLDKAWRDLARLHSIGLRMDKDEPAALEKELAKLTDDKAAWRFTALEYQALLAAKQGQKQRAAEILARVTGDPDAPEDARQRTFSLRELYVAEAKASAGKTE